MLWSLRSTSKSNMCVHVSPSILTRPPRKAKRHETNHQSLSTRLASALARPPPTNGISLGEADFVEEKALESAAFPYSPETRKPWCTLKSLQIRNSFIWISWALVSPLTRNTYIIKGKRMRKSDKDLHVIPINSCQSLRFQQCLPSGYLCQFAMERSTHVQVR